MPFVSSGSFVRLKTGREFDRLGAEHIVALADFDMQASEGELKYCV